jgi:hypothetical protein
VENLNNHRALNIARNSSGVKAGILDFGKFLLLRVMISMNLDMISPK